MAKEYAIVWICNILFIRSSVDGHLGCYHFLAIMNNAAINIHVHIFCMKHMFSILLVIYLRVDLLAHMVTMFNCLMN